LTLDLPQDGIDEGRGARDAEDARALDRFVDGRVRGNAIEMAELVGGDPQDRAYRLVDVRQRARTRGRENGVELRLPA
jgi:hypothetical protein